MQTILDAVLGVLSKEQLQNHVFNHMFNLITGKKGKDLKTDLKKIDTYEAKVDECLKQMKGVVHYSKQYKKHVLESAYKRIVMATDYRPQIKLKSKLVVMKSSKHLQATLQDDYGLSKYSEKPVKVFSLEADHATAPYDLRVSNIVNMFVDTKSVNKLRKNNSFV